MHPNSKLFLLSTLILGILLFSTTSYGTLLTNISPYYAFNNNANDSTLRYNGSASLCSYIPGKIDNAISCPGLATQGINFTNKIITTSNFTLSLWIYSNSTQNASATILSNQNDTNNFGVILSNPDGSASNNISFGWGDGSGSWICVNNRTSIPTNTWTHIAIVKSGLTMLLYKNNSIAINCTGGSDINTASATNMRFMNAPGFTGRGYNGQLDEVAIYNRSLSANEISALYNNYNGNPYPFNQNIIAVYDTYTNLPILSFNATFNSTLTLSTTNGTISSPYTTNNTIYNVSITSENYIVKTTLNLNSSDGYTTIYLQPIINKYIHIKTSDTNTYYSSPCIYNNATYEGSIIGLNTYNVSNTTITCTPTNYYNPSSTSITNDSTNQTILLSPLSIVLNLDATANATLVDLNNNQTYSYQNTTTINNALINLSTGVISIYFGKDNGTWQFYDYDNSLATSINETVHILNNHDGLIYILVRDANSYTSLDGATIRVYEHNTSLFGIFKNYLFIGQHITNGQNGISSFWLDNAKKYTITVSKEGYVLYQTTIAGNNNVYTTNTNPFTIDLTTDIRAITNGVFATYGPYPYTNRSLPIYGYVYSDTATLVYVATSYGATTRGTTASFGNLTMYGAVRATQDPYTLYRYSFSLTPGIDLPTDLSNTTLYIYVKDNLGYRLARNFSINYYNTSANIFFTPTTEQKDGIIPFTLLFLFILIAASCINYFSPEGAEQYGFHIFMGGMIIASFITSAALWVSTICLLYYLGKMLRKNVEVTQ